MVLENDPSVLETGALLAKMKIGFNRLRHKEKPWKCSCGCSLRRDGKSVHLKSKRHKQRMAGKRFNKKKWAMEPCACPLCKTKSTRGNLATHQKTKKCLRRRGANKEKNKHDKENGSAH